MSHLKLVETQSAVELPVPNLSGPNLSAELFTGRRYFVDGDIDKPLPHGVIGDYRISARGSEIHAPVFDLNGRRSIRFWDADVQLDSLSEWVLQDEAAAAINLQSKLKSNTLLLEESELEGPALDDGKRLWMAANFELSFATPCDAARLGILTLVESQRFLDLEGGERVSLLDTGAENGEAAVLYLDPASPTLVTPVETIQPAGEECDYSLSTRVSQPVIESWQGEAVTSSTVLEQYFTYFMQQVIDERGVPQCWLPIHPPVAWGWSIRVGRRVDGEWDIVRRKVIRPTVGHEGVSLPRWENNTLTLNRYPIDLG